EVGTDTVSHTYSDTYGNTDICTSTLHVTAANKTITLTNTSDSVAALSAYSGQLATTGNSGAVTFVTTSTGNAFTVSSSGAVSAAAGDRRGGEAVPVAY